MPEPFRRLEAVAMPLARANVDTDQIVPARFLQKPRSDNFGEYLFKDLRADPAFVLNHCATPKIIVAGRNFGCGSSREHAVWALYDYGFRAAIAPSFGDIFYANALKNGFLPVVIADVDALLKELLEHPGKRLTIDLEAQSAAGRHFDIAPFPKRCLLEGLDEIGYTLSQIEHIDAFERRYAP